MPMVWRVLIFKPPFLFNNFVVRWSVEISFSTLKIKACLVLSAVYNLLGFVKSSRLEPQWGCVKM